MGQTLYEASRKNFAKKNVEKLETKIEYYRNEIELRELVLDALIHDLRPDEIEISQKVLVVLRNKVESLLNERDALKNVL